MQLWDWRIALDWEKSHDEPSVARSGIAAVGTLPATGSGTTAAAAPLLPPPPPTWPSCLVPGSSYSGVDGGNDDIAWSYDRNRLAS